MSEPSSPESLAALADRWERDKSSRIFLQLAEEYRRAGRPGEAIAVLTDGLSHHPSSVAGLVAMGRCRIEIGDEREATEVLERALDLDPAQLVANKLLAEAWIRLGEAEQAGSRLEIYRLLNERDEDLEELDRRLGELVEAGAGESPTDVTSRSGPIFDLRSSAESDPGMTFLARPERGAQVSVAERSEPFTGLMDRAEAESRIVARLAAEQIFRLPEAAPDLQRSAESLDGDAPEAVVPTVAPDEPVAAGEPLADEAASAVAEHEEPQPIESDSPPEARQPMFSLQSIGEEVELETQAEGQEASIVSADAREGPEEREASATLAALYLQQGHLDEAEAEYLSVLESRPADKAARSGLARISDLRSGLASLAPGRRPAEPAAGQPATPAGLTQRKIAVLSRWLIELRQARVG